MEIVTLARELYSGPMSRTPAFIDTSGGEYWSGRSGLPIESMDHDGHSRSKVPEPAIWEYLLEGVLQAE